MLQSFKIWRQDSPSSHVLKIPRRLSGNPIQSDVMMASEHGAPREDSTTRGNEARACDDSITNAAEVSSSSRSTTRHELSVDEGSGLFDRSWCEAVSDNRLTLFGFRRFRTTHLLNLRILEAEIDVLDRLIYQAGLKIDHQPVLDRLGLTYAKRDAKQSVKHSTMDKAFVSRLRKRIKEYGGWILGKGYSVS